MAYKFSVVLLFLAVTQLFSTSTAQTASTATKANSKFENWYNEDLSTDHKFGMSVDRAYEQLLKGKKSKTVIVAIIDSGIDIFHEALDGKVWTNEAEIPGNGIDDDHNGYVDDVHGWSFLGNSKGENVVYENTEVCRLFKALDPKYKNIQPGQVKPADSAEFRFYQKIRKKYLQEYEKAKKEADKAAPFAANYQFADSVMCAYLHKEDYTLTDLKTVNPDTVKILKYSKELLEFLYKQKGFDKSEFKDYLKQILVRYYFHENVDFNPRIIVGDNPENIADVNYGNNDVMGPNPEHGTHVAGIVAANRNNTNGVKGVADNVRIMSLRVVPDGDERDKDIALAIRYATKMGAKVINMSFGKDTSPQKKFVDDAVKEAIAHDVLFVHAAGNDGKDIDTTDNFPSDILQDKSDVKANWITVGASSMKRGKDLPAVFSNYGKKEVDIFAPGVNIYNLKPGNQYKENDGTSMASPMVTGLAAMLRSYYPTLTAPQVKECILKSAKVYKHKVFLPEEGSSKRPKVRFDELSVSGGVANVYNAVKLAETMCK
ncbi:MAG: S8 family peptidase [Bacteroidota bacterium]|nr:S8 family peptidase [Bacteroidota bacterium]